MKLGQNKIDFYLIYGEELIMNILLAVGVHWVFAGYHAGTTLTPCGGISVETHVNFSQVLHSLVRGHVHVQTLIGKKGEDEN